MSADRQDKELDKWLAMEDFELCDKVVGRIFDRHGNQIDLSKYNDEERVVTLVWQASGIIDNGGFLYLFEGTFPGDPYFAKTVAAFEAIQATECAKGLREELSIFPGSKPPRDIEQRLQIHEDAAGAVLPRNLRSRLGVKDNKICPIDRWYNQNREIPKLLASYIRENRAAFK